MKQFLDTIRDIRNTGLLKTDRTGTGTISKFGKQMRFDLQEYFPLLGEKFTSFKMIKIELIWLLSGNTNIKFLLDNECHIWDEWADQEGNLGPVYGAQWRSWKRYVEVDREPGGLRHCFVEEVDQIAEAIHKLKTKPDDRRIIVSAWNVGEIPTMNLPPCHAFFQFYTRELTLQQRVDHYFKKTGDKIKGEPTHELYDQLEVPRFFLDAQLYQRSADMFLGVPFNIASYSLLTHMIAQVVNMVPGEFVWTGGDCHIYSNHFDQVDLLLSRPEVENKTLLVLNPEIKNIDDFKISDLDILHYKHLGAIKAPVAV